ncbi:MAG: hypothetical protein K0U84_22470 [Actinomycetia bacterium]|nr:hypothetical protein [Actinomycetes bacterium]
MDRIFSRIRDLNAHQAIRRDAHQAIRRADITEMCRHRRGADITEMCRPIA